MGNVKVVINGVEVSGPPEKVKEMLGEQYPFGGDEVTYYSQSKGPIRIRCMASAHIRNALLKLYERWLQDLRLLDPVEFERYLAKGPDTAVMRGLIKEIHERTRLGYDWSYVPRWRSGC